MKKVVPILFVLLLISVTGCSQKTEYFTPESHATGLSALKTIDQYLAGEIEGDEAKEKLDRFYDTLEIYADDIYSDSQLASSNIDNFIASISLDSVSLRCFSASIKISSIEQHPNDASEEIEELIDIRNEMKGWLEDPEAMWEQLKQSEE